MAAEAVPEVRRLVRGFCVLRECTVCRSGEDLKERESKKEREKKKKKERGKKKKKREKKERVSLTVFGLAPAAGGGGGGGGGDSAAVQAYQDIIDEHLSNFVELSNKVRG